MTTVAKRRQTVDIWVQSVIAEIIDGRQCSAVTCLHLKGVGGATEEVVTRPLGEGPVNVKELADHLIGRAEGFAQELPGLQTFKLLAFYGTAEPHNPFHFTVSDGTVISRSEAMQSAHEPTPTGLLGQLMKHNEQLAQQCMQLTQSNMQLAQGVIGMCLGPQGLIAQSRQSELDAIEVVRDATLNMLKERNEARLQEVKAVQDLETRRTIMQAIPHMVNRWTGHEVFSETANDSAIIAKLAMKVSPQDLDMLVQMGKLSQEEALILSARFASIVESKKKELDALKTVPTEESDSSLTVPNGLNGKG